MAAKTLRFLTAREIEEQTLEEVDWVCRPYIARGAITEVDGKPKAAGKTTLVTHACRNMLDGKRFLGEPTVKTGIIYLTEQSRGTFREVLDRADLLGRDDFTVLFWGDTMGKGWSEVVREAAEEAVRRRAGLLVVDTLPQFAGLKGDAENNAGAALSAIQPLQEAAAAHNLAVVVIRHERKSGGEVGDSGRGSSAFAGAVDVVLSVRRTQGNGNPNVREIRALSRFDETPDTLVVELTPDGYEVRGEETAVVTADARSTILKIAPTTQEEAMTLGEFVEAVDVVGRTTIQNILQAMVDDEEKESELMRIGEGKRGNPYRFWRPGDAEDVEELQGDKPSLDTTSDVPVDAATTAPLEVAEHEDDADQLLASEQAREGVGETTTADGEIYHPEDDVDSAEVETSSKTSQERFSKILGVIRQLGAKDSKYAFRNEAEDLIKDGNFDALGFVPTTDEIFRAQGQVYWDEDDWISNRASYDRS